MKYAVISEYCGTLAWYGLYNSLSTAEEVAKRVNGKVVLWGK